jgi:large conductance mechanosensitive channel
LGTRAAANFATLLKPCRTKKRVVRQFKLPASKDTSYLHMQLTDPGCLLIVFAQLFIKGVCVMAILQEFKQFALKGNVMDLAVGVIIGGAFGKIVDSLVNDVIMPIVGKLFGGFDFSNNYLALNGQAADLTLVEAKKLGAVLAYGNFVTIVLNFVILAFIIFQMVKFMNRLKQDDASAPPLPVVTPEDVLLLREIRDSLKK